MQKTKGCHGLYPSLLNLALDAKNPLRRCVGDVIFCSQLSILYKEASYERRFFNCLYSYSARRFKKHDCYFKPLINASISSCVLRSLLTKRPVSSLLL